MSGGVGGVKFVDDITDQKQSLSIGEDHSSVKTMKLKYVCVGGGGR